MRHQEQVMAGLSSTARTWGVRLRTLTPYSWAMHWLNYVFFGLLLALGGTVSVLFLRAKNARVWVWLAIALVGAAGIAGLLAGRADGAWRTLALSAVFYLFAVDHLVQHVRSQ